MSDLTRSRTYNNAITNENANEGASRQVRRSKTIAGASLGAQRRELAEVKNWQSQQSQDDLKLETSTQEVRSQNCQESSQDQPSRKKQKIYRSDDENSNDDDDHESLEFKLGVSATDTIENPILASYGTSARKDLDSDEKDDVYMVVEYTNDIFDYLYQRECQTTPTYNYLTITDSPQHLRPSLRAILIDWLVEVHQKFQLLPETLYLAINVMDRFMSLRKVSMAKLQLLAVSSLLIAAKFEEINLPKLSQYAYITDGACSCQDIKDAEMYVLTTLKFNIGWPNPLNFLRRISKADDYDNKTRSIAKFFLEYAMCCPRFVNIVPSHCSAMAMYCARASLDKNDKWDETFEHYSGGIDAVNDKEFQKLCRELIQEISKPTTQLKALEAKYKSNSASSVFEPARVWCNLMVAGSFEGLFEE
ncbi:LANO_0F09934g1_1 [Lachancea nothofagi CBS 11611]|uniref:LANO_0F09934g1_1 n=1 Tax=Lachancea nothofagi CBS 11611 TaxID=1266666 RepID=A0A1G4KA88_9SACH|nr:LANO_0F09934g1_1 [Lachancea nothofagi CBS 11611]